MPYNARDMDDIRTSVNDRVAIAGYIDDCLVSKDDVLSAYLS